MSYYNNEYDNYYRPRQSAASSGSDDPWTNSGYHSQPAPEPEPPKKKKRTGLKIVAGLLAFALVVGAGVGTGYLLWGREKAADAAEESVDNSTEIYVSDRETVEVQPVKVTGNQKMTLTEVYASNVASAVSIRASTTTNYFGQAVESASAGSGFIITKDGFVVTNYHVVEGATKVTITLYDGTEYEAIVMGGDADYDLAVLKVDPGEGNELQPVVIGDSAALQVGDTIAAIGNPLGELTFSMSEGIVSCVDRLINVDGTPFNMIQITAAVNSGNSGGPLFNTYGEVIGIVSAKYSSSSSGASVEGLGFAIPINDVISMIEDIMTNNFVRNKPSLAIFGGTFSSGMNPEAGTETGVYVYSVQKGGAAEKAGLQAGDVIVKIGDYEVTGLEDVSAMTKYYNAGDTVTVEFYRGGEKQETELTFDAAKEEQEQEQQTQQQPPQGNQGGGYYYDPFDYFDYFFGNPFFG